MKFIARRDFLNNVGLKIKKTPHPRHVPAGSEFEIGEPDATEIKALTHEQQTFVHHMIWAGAILPLSEENKKIVQAEMEKAAASMQWALNPHSAARVC